METERAAPPSDGGRFQRMIGRFTAGRRGPTLLVCGGLHGNEPAGVRAAQRVCARLEQDQPALRGELFALAGNLTALAQGRRFVERDLNRVWTDERIVALRAREARENGPEDSEQLALLDAIEEAGARARGPIALLDLHTASGITPPFALMADTLPNRRLAFAFPGPVILGLEEQIDGTLLEFVTERGHGAVVVEAGQHDDPRSVQLHEAVIWIMIVAAGLLKRRQVLGFDALRARLREACQGFPRVVEVCHRHGVEPGDEFRMQPGYTGFCAVEQGELLAHDRRGAVRAPMRGRLLLPLYQEQGQDGFFIVRPVRRIWLVLSRILRELRLGGLLPILPGVRRHPSQADALCVDPRIARLCPVQVFHLFGYRRRRQGGNQLVFSRRCPR